jgi:hypothetical protein
MQRISKLYVSHFGTPTAWYEHLLFDLTDPDTLQPTDVIFNLENAGGKTSLLSYIFSCFEPKQDRWLQHLQEKSHRFAEYFVRGGRISIIAMEWDMGGQTSLFGSKLIIGQAVALRDSIERGGDVERYFFAFSATDDLGLKTIPAPGLSTDDVHTMQEFERWLHQVSRRAGDLFYTKTQDDWIKHLGNTRLLDIELLRMQVDFNSNEGGMAEGFLTFNTESDLLRRFLLLTLDPEKSQIVRDAVAQTSDKLKAKPKYECRLEQLTRLQSVFVPFSEAAARYGEAVIEQMKIQRQASGLAAALDLRNAELSQTAIDKQSYAQAQDKIANDSISTASLFKGDVVAMEGLQHERKVEVKKIKKDKADEILEQAKDQLRCLEGAKAWSLVLATDAQIKELEATVEREQEGLIPARQQVEQKGALLISALNSAENTALERSQRATLEAANAKSLINEINVLTNTTNNEITTLSVEKGKLDEFKDNYRHQRDRLVNDKLLEENDADINIAIERLEYQAELEVEKLDRLTNEHQVQEELERHLRDQAGKAELEATVAKAAQETPRKFLADGEALREELRQLSILRLASDADEVDPDSVILLDSLDRLRGDAHLEIADKNVRLAQTRADRDSIIETGLAGRNADVDEVIRNLQNSGIRSAKAANIYVSELRSDVEEARELVLSDPARFYGVNVAQGEWLKAQQLASTFNFKFSAPVTIAVATLDVCSNPDDRLVIGPRDDAAYNKASAQHVLTLLDKRISDLEQQRTYYEERRDQASESREKVIHYQSKYGVARLRQVAAEIERHKSDEQAALNRQQDYLLQADEAKNRAIAIKEQLNPLPAMIEKMKTGIQRITDFRNDWDAPLVSKCIRLQEICSLLEDKQNQLEDLALQLSAAEHKRELGVKDAVQYQSFVKELAREKNQVTYFDPDYPIDKQLSLYPQDIEMLRKAYRDAESFFHTQERDRLGVLAEKLERTRSDKQNAITAYDNKFSELDKSGVLAFRNLDLEIATLDQHRNIEQLDTTSRKLGEALAALEATRDFYWKEHKTSSRPSPDIQEKSDDELTTAIEIAQAEIKRHEEIADKARQENIKASSEANQAKTEASQLETLLSSLKAAIPDTEEAEPILLPGNDITAFANGLIAQFHKQNQHTNTLRSIADSAFRNITKAASNKELVEIEPELARDIADSEFEAACSDRERILELIEDRLSATRDTLDSMKPDFENCVGELYNLTYEGISLLTRACAKTMPFSAPYVGGKPILKMKASFSGIPVENRKEAIRQYLNGLIKISVIPAKGADLVAQSLIDIYGRKELGLQVLKMEQNEVYQYQYAGELKGSKGQGTVIAMFLYLLISQLRADTQASAKRGGGGPLILDNPFAKVQTRALIDVQRLLAKEIGVQLIFFTANADYNILSGFRRVIRLRKSGANNKTSRSHIEMASAAFEDLAETTESEA